jgi:Na+/proline symporter
MNLEIASLFLILFAVIIIVWGIAVVHTLPGKIATKRNHSQVEAIEIMSYLGLLVFPLWMEALIWASGKDHGTGSDRNNLLKSPDTSP